MIVIQKLFEILFSNFCSRKNKTQYFFYFFTNTDFLIYIYTFLGGQNTYNFRGFCAEKDTL